MVYASFSSFSIQWDWETKKMRKLKFFFTKRMIMIFYPQPLITLKVFFNAQRMILIFLLLFFLPYLFRLVLYLSLTFDFIQLFRRIHQNYHHIFFISPFVNFFFVVELIWLRFHYWMDLSVYLTDLSYFIRNKNII